MSELTAQLPTLFGVVIGALASYLIAFAGDRSRWRREADQRRQDRRTEVYAAYGRAVKGEYQWTMRLAHTKGLPAFGTSASYDEVHEEMLRAGHERATAWEEVLLLGSPDVIQAARRWHESIWLMQEVARDADGAAKWPETMELSLRARTAFYAAARSELGISPALIPEGTDPAAARGEATTP